MFLNILMITCFIFLCIFITFLVINRENVKEMRALTPYEEQQHDLMKSTITQWSNGQLSNVISTEQNK